MLKVSLDCESSFTLSQEISITVKVTYESPRKGYARPIVFHTYPFLDNQTKREGYRLYCQRDDKWEKFEKDGATGFILVDDPDVQVNVATDKHFQCLSPGESWSHMERLKTQDTANFPGLDDAKAGDKFRFLFKGTHIDWWDWGSAEEHSNTVVKLPCWLFGPVVDPKDNGGRPKLIVSCSEPVEFVLV